MPDEWPRSLGLGPLALGPDCSSYKEWTEYLEASPWVFLAWPLISIKAAGHQSTQALTSPPQPSLAALLPQWPSSKESACHAGDTVDVGSIPGLGRSPGGGNGNQSSILAWRIPWTEEPGGLQSMESQRVRHDWATEHTLMHLLPARVSGPSQGTPKERPRTHQCSPLTCRALVPYGDALDAFGMEPRVDAFSLSYPDD